MMVRKIATCGAAMVAVLALHPGEARAEHKHWNSFFEIFFGFGSEDGYVRGGYRQGGPVCAPSPAPVPVSCPAPRPRIWIPEHYETRTVCREVPGYWKEEWVPPVYEERYDPCTGWGTRVLVREGWTRYVWIPGYTVREQVQVLVPGRWADA